MKLFVTGAGGFIGSHFVERALADGHQVVALSRSEAPVRRRLLAQLRAAGADIRPGDLLDVDSLRDALEGAEVVCHFAAAFTEAGEDEEYFHRVNVLGTRSLAMLAARQGVRRFVHCSTAGIYGRRVPGRANEDAPMQPWNAYERSKLASEIVLREIAQARGMEYVVLRPSVVYGPRDARMRKLFRMVSRGRFPLFGSGDGRRHMVHVSDVVDAFMRACTEPGAANKEMIIAGREPVPLRHLLRVLADIASVRRYGPQLPLAPMLLLAALTEDLCRLLRVSPPLHRRRMDFYVADAAFDCSRARELLGWEPKVELTDGLARTLQAYRDDDAADLGWTPAVPPRAPSSHR
jgi:nucleoside-diphosphate-sugar epimerase